MGFDIKQLIKRSALLTIGILYIGGAHLHGQNLSNNKSTKNSTKKRSTSNSSTTGNQAVDQNNIQSTDIAMPYFVKAKSFQPQQSLFFDFNIGAGFLYFSGIKGNTFVKYEDSASTLINHSLYGSNAIRGPINYNRSPVFESILGYRFNQWFKMALSYQHQGNISVQMPMLLGLGGDPAVGVTPNSSFSQLRSNLCLDALLFKVYFEFPCPLIWQGLAYTPFIALAVGPGWQSWMNNELQQTTVAKQSYTSVPLPLRNKIVANPVWMVDAGIRMQRSITNQTLSFLLGCRFTDWGQARNIGKYTQQANVKRGLPDPFQIKMLYSFAPYAGFEWDFPVGSSVQRPVMINGNNANNWEPFIAKAEEVQSAKSFFVQCNIGPGFLYFSNIRGSYYTKYEDSDTTLNNSINFGSRPIDGPIQYNRTPAIESLMGYRFNQWFKAAIAYQHQGNIFIQTPLKQAQYPIEATRPDQIIPGSAYTQLRSNLNLDALLLKLYLEMPYPLIWKGICSFTYLGAGAGVGWQSWTNTTLNQTQLTQNDLYLSSPLSLRDKFSANAVWMIDAGMRLKTVYQNSPFSVLFGCKFMDWGQARNIGKYTQQANVKRGLADPFRVKMVYSFIPYLGFQWDFPVGAAVSPPQLINGRNPNRWKPFITAARNIQSQQSLFTQFNVGAGFLYFSGIRGSTLAAYQDAITNTYNNTYYGENNIRGPLSYNRTPVLEAMMGYRPNQWIKTAISYQHQGNISIQTPMIYQLAAGNEEVRVAANSAFAQLRASLNLDALLLKVYFELPYPLVCKGVGFFPYLAAGVGAGWQSWTSISLQFAPIADAQYAITPPLPLRNKIIPNVAWMLDSGFRLQKANLVHSLSLLFGCKFMDWGQARNIGKYTQQANVKVGMPDPLIVKMVYSFIPYVGVQWDF